MKRQIVITKKRSGHHRQRNAHRVHPQPDLMAPIDAWAALQDGEPGRSEATCRLVEFGLKAKGK
jgi:hypothetical protein